MHVVTVHTYGSTSYSVLVADPKAFLLAQGFKLHHPENVHGVETWKNADRPRVTIAWVESEGNFIGDLNSQGFVVHEAGADVWAHDPQRDGGGCTWCGSFAQVDSDNLCRECFAADDDGTYVGSCPACGSPIDYCQGHGPSGDPEGARILEAHDDDDHSDCHPDGCDDYVTRPSAMAAGKSEWDSTPV